MSSSRMPSPAGSSPTGLTRVGLAGEGAADVDDLAPPLAPGETRSTSMKI